MPENPNQPREYDAVLGGDRPPPTYAAILGGLEGVKRRFGSTVEAQRILALQDAVNYGESGLDFVIQALQDKSVKVKHAAYSLLRTKTETKAKVALQEFNPYQFFECLHTLEGHSYRVDSVAIAPDGKTIVSGSWDNTIKVWDIGAAKCKRTLQGHSDFVRSVAISPDGKTIVSGSSDKTIKVWDMLTGECKGTLQGHSGWVMSVAIAPDGKTIVSGSWDDTIRVWDIEAGKCNYMLQGPSSLPVMSVAIAPNGKPFVSGSTTVSVILDKTIKVWDLVTGKCKSRLGGGHLDSVCSVAIAPNGKTFVSGSDNNGIIKVWDILTGECQRTLVHSAPVASSVRSVAIAPDGKTIVSGLWNGFLDEWRSDYHTIKVWDIEAGECKGTLQGHSNWVGSVAIAPDGKTIVSGSSDNTIKVWGIR